MNHEHDFRNSLTGQRTTTGYRVCSCGISRDSTFEVEEVQETPQQFTERKLAELEVLANR